MADKKISALTSYTTPLDADVLPIVDTANTLTKKVTWANIKTTLANTFAVLASPVFTGVVTLPSGFKIGSVTTTFTGTEANYLTGVTSALQTQLDAKQLRSTLTAKGDIYVATASNVVARQAIGSDGQVLTADSAQTNGLKWATPGTVYGADAGSNDTYVVTITGIASYTAGQLVQFKANTANTGAATLNVNSLGAITIKKNKNVDLNDNDIKAGQIVNVIYDGTNFQLLSPVANALTYAVGTQNLGPYTASATTDTTITINFQPRLIKLYYSIQGHTPAAGSNHYTGRKGIAIFSGTSLVADIPTWYTDENGGDTIGLSGDQGVPTTFSSLTMTQDNTGNSTLTTGAVNNSNNDISTTMTINSISSTGFVVRIVTDINTGTNSSNARANFFYEAYA